MTMKPEHAPEAAPAAAPPAAVPPMPKVGVFERLKRAHAHLSHGTRRLLQWLLYAALAGYFAFGLLVLLLRHVLLPGIGDWKDEIAAVVAQRLGVPVSIERIEARWSGLRPRLVLDQVDLRDADARPALHLQRVEATLAWSSLLLGEPRFHRLELFGPQLELRREPDGRILVAGLPVDPAASGDRSGLAWLLAQRTLSIRDAALRWHDARRGAPILHLDKVNLLLENRGRRHRFGLSAAPPAELAARLDLRGDLRFADPLDPATWKGQLYARLDYADLGGWRAWVDEPWALSGSGALRLWLELDAGEWVAGNAQLALAKASARFAPDLPPLRMRQVSGRLAFHRDGEAFEMSARQLLWQGEEAGGTLGPADFSLRRPHDPAQADSRLSLRNVDLGVLGGLMAHLPLPSAWRVPLEQHAPQGRVEQLDARWRGDEGWPVRWSLIAHGSGLAWRAGGALPGVSGLSLDLEGDQDGGQAKLAGQQLRLDAPEVFVAGPLGFDTFQAQFGWRRPGGQLEVALEHASFANPDTRGSASGRYWPRADGPGEIELTARLDQTDGAAVWRYLPAVVNQDTRDWLRRALLAGRAEDARLRLKGDLARFPFRHNEGGQFLVTARIRDARLDYAPGWPAIDDIDGELRFEGARMQIRAERGRIFGVRLGEVLAEVPDLEAAEERMLIRGTASGPTSDFLRFIDQSPVAARIDRFTEGMRAEGQGRLTLKLDMPLRQVRDTRIEGEFRPARNRLWLLPWLPPLEEASAKIGFTEDSLGISDGRARFLGEVLQIGARTREDGALAFNVRGQLSAAALRRELDWPIFDHLSGSAPLALDLAVRARGSELVASSSLQGLSSSLPAPLNKSAAEALPLRVELELPAGGGREHGRLTLGDWGRAEWLRRADLPGLGIERGSIGINRPALLPERGLRLALELPALDVDAWREALLPAAASEPDGAGKGEVLPVELQFKVAQMKVFDERLEAVELRLAPTARGWKGQIDSRQMAGSFDWQAAGEGRLHARLGRLAIGEAGEGGNVDHEPGVLRRLPGLDIEAADFRLRGMPLGRLELLARNQDGIWQLEKLALRSPDGVLEGSGRWLSRGEPQRTWLDFRLDTEDAGAYLGRLGHPAALRGGKAGLKGEVSWQGAPIRVDYPSLQGRLELLAENGQFRKLEPGVGRLLGVLSLQSLPRRITLDFRDVFSEGFAFDRVSGSIEIDRGVMRTENLEIRGPAARVFMRGSTNLDQETQDLRVTVQPTLSESVAIGAAAGLINPVAGVITYLAQKTLGDPIEKLFSFDYAVTGRWDDPKVDKLVSPPPPSARP